MSFNNFFRKKTPTSSPAWNEQKTDDFHFELIEHYFRNKDNSSAFQIISDQFINDIDFYELFQFIDRTSSKIGQQYLFNQLLTIKTQIDFEEQEALVNYFIQNEEKRIKGQILLSNLNKRESHYISYLFINDYISKPKWFWIIPTLSVTVLLSIIFTFIISKVFILLLLCVILNMVIHFWNKRNIMAYMDSIHDIELTEFLSAEYDLYHFTETIHDQQIRFDYKLKPGNLTTTNAIRVLEINDYPEEVISEAKKISGLLRNHNS